MMEIKPEIVDRVMTSSKPIVAVKYSKSNNQVNPELLISHFKILKILYIHNNNNNLWYFLCLGNYVGERRYVMRMAS
jgi:hypothetical protein